MGSRLALPLFVSWLAALVVACLSIAPPALPSGYGTKLLHRTNVAVRDAQVCQLWLDRDQRPDPTRHTYARSHSIPFRLWSLHLWQKRARGCHLLTAYLDELPPRAIKYVFGRIGQDGTALIVAGREGGSGDIYAHPFCTNAKNGEHLGCFQMGEWERRTFGHGSTALDQAWAAYNYVVRAHGWCSGWSATAPGC